MTSATQEAVRTNLFLLAQDHAVEAGAEEIRKARAHLLPQLNVTTEATFIDKDRAQAGFGAQAQRSASASATFEQVIFSESAWASTSPFRCIQAVHVLQRERRRRKNWHGT